ncbi:mannose-specific lectin [Novymonas esmeraldas]|uniref:Mannose-specific lectin n=1 Tax=Novymonas esmeraldas TaxID=1808958 RepID=A0AAW0EMA2_9TRYP
MARTHVSGPRLGRQRHPGRGWTARVSVAALLAALCAGAWLAGAVDHVPKLTAEQEHRGGTRAISHHSFAPPLLRQYYGDGEIPHWTISGATVVTDNYVRLTADQKSQTGHLLNLEPLDMDAFEVVVGFRVYRPMGGLGADGFAVWVAQPPRFDGPIFGRPSTFNGFGVVFDSYDNDNRRDNPMVSLLLNDGSNKKRFDPDNDFMGQSVASCVFDYRSTLAPQMATMRMVYHKGDLDVYLSTNSEMKEVECFSVTSLPLPSVQAYLSISAQTGGVSDIHDIIFVHVSPLEAATYTHDVQQTVLPVDEIHDAQLYDNEVMNNRHGQHSTKDTVPPSTETRQPAHEASPSAQPQHYEHREQQPQQQQQQYQQQQPQQQQYQQQQPQQQQPQQQQQPPQQQYQQPEQQQYQQQQPQQQQQQYQQHQPPQQQPQPQQQQQYQQQQPPPQQQQYQQQQPQQQQDQQQQPQQQQYQQQQPQQQQYQQQQPEQQQQQYQQQQQQPQQQPAADAAGAKERRLIEELRRKLDALERRGEHRDAAHTEENDDGEEVEYERDEHGQLHRKRVRRARTPRHNQVDDEF